MVSLSNLKELSFLVYGLGLTGQSVVKFFRRKKITNFTVWDDTNNKIFKNKRVTKLNKALNEVDYIVLSPGVSLSNSKNKDKLIRYKKKLLQILTYFIWLTKI